MNNYFKERMDEIQLRTEHMAERKNYELEINSLEEKLNDLECNYQRLQTTYKLNLEQSALKQVDLEVAKDAYAFAKAMLDKNEVSLVQEKRKLDDLHWQIWEEQIKVCDEMGRCVAENDSVSFLNDYPRVLKTQKYAFHAVEGSDHEIKRSLLEHPEIKQLRAEVAALETKIKKIEDSCFSGDLQMILTEIMELNSNDDYKGDETQRLIEALEHSHRQRMSLEAEITEIEERKVDLPHDGGKPTMNQIESNHLPCVKKELRFYPPDISLISDEERLKMTREKYHDYELPVAKEQEKKLKARIWYQEYTREIAVANEENYLKNFHPSVRQWDVSNISEQQGGSEIISNENCLFSTKSEELQSKKEMSLEREYQDEVKAENADRVEFGVSKGKFYPKTVVKRKSSVQKSQPAKFRYFGAKINYPKQKKEDVNVKAVTRGTPKANRKFEPLMATPSTFLKSAAETALDNNSIQSSYDEEPSTSAQGIMKVKKTGIFTLKRPSNIGKQAVYRQTKLDDFDNFMLPDNKYIMQRK